MNLSFQGNPSLYFLRKGFHGVCIWRSLLAGGYPLPDPDPTATEMDPSNSMQGPAWLVALKKLWSQISLLCKARFKWVCPRLDIWNRYRYHMWLAVPLRHVGKLPMKRSRSVSQTLRINSYFFSSTNEVKLRAKQT